MGSVSRGQSLAPALAMFYRHFSARIAPMARARTGAKPNTAWFHRGPIGPRWKRDAPWPSPLGLPIRSDVVGALPSGVPGSSVSPQRIAPIRARKIPDHHWAAGGRRGRVGLRGTTAPRECGNPRSPRRASTRAACTSCRGNGQRCQPRNRVCCCRAWRGSAICCAVFSDSNFAFCELSGGD